MKQNKGKIVQGNFNYSYLSEETIRKAVVGYAEALQYVYEKYMGYVRYTIRKTAIKEGKRLDKTLMEELDQQVWKGLVKILKNLKYDSFLF